jgi:hypothetical protein
MEISFRERLEERRGVPFVPNGKKNASATPPSQLSNDTVVH